MRRASFEDKRSRLRRDEGAEHNRIHTMKNGAAMGFTDRSETGSFRSRWFRQSLGIGRRLAVAAGCALAAIQGGCHLARPPLEKRAQVEIGTGGETVPARQADFAAAIDGADRIEVRRVVAGGAGEIVLARKRAGVGHEFADAVRIDELAGPFRCACEGNHLVRFFHDDALLAEVTVHHARSLRWKNGPWGTDALIAGAAGEAFAGWFLKNGGSVAGLLATDEFPVTIDSSSVSGNLSVQVESRPGHSDGSGAGMRTFLRQQSEAESASAHERLLACFPSGARALLSAGGGTIVSTLEPRLISSPLAAAVPDRVELAAAAFCALGALRTPWLEDDTCTGMVQTAAAGLPQVDITTALERCARDEQSMRGAARIYFRFGLHRRFDPAHTAQWLPALADAVMRTGDPRDKSLLLVYLASAEHRAAWEFLRELATGARVYAWSFACGVRGDVPQEPSLRASAAVLLAIHDAADAPGLAASSTEPVFGLDAAAVEVARTLRDASHPLTAAAFRYPSHILGFAAVAALERQAASTMTAATLTAGLAHQDYWVTRRVRMCAEAIGLTRFREPTEVDLFAAPVAQTLAAENPREAVERCTERLSTASRLDRTALLLIRAVAYENLGETTAAITDFENALRAGGYPEGLIHRKLAWLCWNSARLAEAARSVEHALADKPDADMFVLRGLTRYAMDDFSAATELDFSAASALQPNHGYATIFQHLCSHLGGRPERSRLFDSAPVRDSTPTVLTLDLGNLVVRQSGGAVPPWPANVIAFLKGELTEDELLARASEPGSPEAVTQVAEAHYYISQQARLSGDHETERRHLEACICTPVPDLAEYQLARQRLNRLR
jgi:hypothetical protein